MFPLSVVDDDFVHLIIEVEHFESRCKPNPWALCEFSSRCAADEFEASKMFYFYNQL